MTAPEPAPAPWTPASDHDPQGGNFGHYIVAVADVLNQRSALQGWSRFPKEGESDAQFLGAVKQTVGSILALRDAMAKYVGQFGKGPPDAELWNLLTPPQQKDYLKLTESRIGLQVFSDTCVLFAPLRVHEGALLLKDVWGVLLGMAILMPGMLSGKIAIRAGIEIGTATDVFPGQIYGPSLASAYHLESEVAEYPRIVIGPALFGLIREAASSSLETPHGQFSRAMATEIQSLIAWDDDGVLILDYLGEYVRAHDAGMDMPIEPLVRRAATFVASEHERFRRERNIKLAGRYARLRRYFDGRMHLWIDDPTENAVAQT